MTTMEQLQLVNDFANAAYDCGNWNNEDSDETYNTVFQRYEIARQNIFNAFALLQSNTNHKGNTYETQ